MASCVMCGSPMPDNQGSRTCSMCYGDIGHGRDGYYRASLEREAERAVYEVGETEAATQEAMAEGEKE
jgi:hypothetical protein